MRLLASAALASALLAGDLVLLTLFLNPQATLRRDGPALVFSLFVPYTLAGLVVLLLVAALVAAVRGGAPPPPGRRAWELVPGLPGFGGMALLALAAAAGVFWFNLFSYRHSMPLPSLRGLAVASACLTGAALVLGVVALDARLFPHRGRGLSSALAVLAPASALVMPLALRPEPAPRVLPARVQLEPRPPLRRVTLIGLDGLGPGQLREAVERGKVPALARIMRRGAYGPLATLRPTEGPAIWTTVFTGQLPRDHGVKSFGSYRLRGSPTTFEALPKGALVGLAERLGLVSTSTVTSASRQRRALWDALNAFGIGAGVVRFWGTFPPERLQGFMLSHYFHLLKDDPARVRGTLYPPDLVEEVRARAVAPGDVDRALVSEFVDLSVELPGDPVPWRRELVEKALAPDLTYHRAGAVLRAAYDPPFFAIYYHGLDVVGHAFTRFAHPDRFGNVAVEEARRYGGVCDAYAELLSRWVGEAAQSLGPGDVLLVVSGHGMQPVSPWRRLLGWLAGGTEASGTHAGAPDGVLLGVGDGIRAGAVLKEASVLDVAPTILYLMGLPVARDMEGRVLTEMLEEDFTRAHHLSFLPSYDAVAGAEAPGAPVSDLPPLPEEP
ncbi:MAG TPA: alkaline phosphatase family protein [Vicinamibacteria bacterium]|nr:alkaline phosphatase family protein [Vicinamibacteria bacterium]